ncbi:MAG: immunoglobulin domain-containing protein [Acidobacteria bacterium]|nr:immunoglobulin domain-containing protein [Acidobacteriota bacterium]
MERRSGRYSRGRSVLFLMATLVAACAWAPGAAVVVLDSAFPVEESCSPVNEQPDPGETLTYLVFLANTGDEATTNLVATLLPTGGVTNPGAPCVFGALPPGGTGNPGSFAFTVDPAVACGGTFTLTLQLQDGATDLGTVSATFRTGTGGPDHTYDSGGVSVAIPDNDPAGATVPIPVGGIGKVAYIEARVRINHSFDGDLTLSLTAPDGTTVVLSDQNGGSGDNFGSGAADCSGSFTVFTDASFTPIASGSAPFDGSFQPDQPLSAFEGKDINGTWTLKVVDGFGGDTGTVYCVQLYIQKFSCCGVPEPPLVVVAGSALEAEGCSPPNGAVDPEEDVTVGLSLQNTGGTATSDLVATLQAGNGVTNPGPAQAYGVLNPGDPAVTRSFTFTADPTSPCGSTITLTLQLQDGATDLGTVHYTLTLGAVVTSAYGPFANTGSISIPVVSPKAGVLSGLEAFLLPSTGIPGIPYPSPITVSGYPSTLAKVTATLTGLSHQCPEQVYALLVGPSGQAVMLVSAAGGCVDTSGVNLTFDDDAASTVPSPLASGTYKPTSLGPVFLPAPAPTGPYSDSLSAFKGTDPNGTWNLFIYDDTGIVSGGLIAGGWSLELFFTSATCCYPPPCVILSCDGTAAPASGYAPLPVTFTGTALTENCDDPPTYMWTFGDGETGFGETVSHTYAAPGTYNWSLLVSAGPMYCNDSGTVEVLACTPAAVTTSPSSTSVCAGQTTTLTVVAAGDPAPTYQWYRDGTPVGADSPSYTTSPSDPSASYTVTVTNPCGSETSTPALVTVNPLPTPVISGPTSVCAGDSVTLDAGAGYYVYLWSPGGQTSQTITVSPSVTTTYTVMVVDSHPCSGTSAGHTVTVNPLPTPAITGPTAVCAGGGVTLDAGAGYSTYTWSPGGETTPSVTVSPAVATTYTVTVTDANGCTGTSPGHAVTVNPLPTPAITGPYVVCSGSSVTLDAGAGYSTYTWSPGGETTPSVTVSPAVATTYTVTVTDANGCTGTSPGHAVTVNPLPTPAITGPTAVCAGGSATLDAGSGYYAYLWSPGGETTPSITVSPTVATTYAVTVTDAYLCQGTSAGHAVAISPNTQITQQPQSVAINPGESATLTVAATGGGALSYQWYQGVSGDTGTPVGANSPSFTTPALSETTAYWVRATGDCGSADSDTAVISVGAGPVITHLDFPMTVCSGAPATLTMTVTGSEPLTYQWDDSPDGVSFTPIPGAAQRTFVTPPLTATRVFRGTATNPLGTDRRIVKVTVIEAPEILSVTPPTQQVNTGHSATLEVVCTGSGPLAVQWYEGESGDVSHPVEGANSTVFHTPQVYADTRYWVRVSNACGDADSATATVIVWNVYYLPHAVSTAEWWTRLSFVNAGGLNPKAGPATSEVEVRAYAADGELLEEVFLDVPPQTQYEADLDDLLPPGTPMGDLWLRVESRNELKGLMQFGARDGGSRTSLPLLEWPTRKAVFPHVSSILGWFTGITFVNTADVPAEVLLSAYAEDGALLAGTALPLGPRSKHARQVTEIFPPELDVLSIKSLGVESNQPLLGFELFGNPQRHGEGVAGLPLVRLDERKPENFFFGLFYPEAAESDTWYKSVTFTNLDAGPGIVMADAYDAAGVKLGSEIITLNPREQMTREVRELFPPPAYEALDYFLLGSFSAIAGFELTLSRNAPFRFDGLLAIEQAYPRQVFPAVVPGSTRLRLVNKSDSPMDLTVKAFSAGGLLLGTHPVTLTRNAKADLDVSAVIFTDGVIAWLLVEGNNLFTAHAFIATPDGECLVTYPGVPLY